MDTNKIIFIDYDNLLYNGLSDKNIDDLWVLYAKYRVRKWEIEDLLMPLTDDEIREMENWDWRILDRLFDNPVRFQVNYVFFSQRKDVNAEHFHKMMAIRGTHNASFLPCGQDIAADIRHMADASGCDTQFLVLSRADIRNVFGKRNLVVTDRIDFGEFYSRTTRIFKTDEKEIFSWNTHEEAEYEECPFYKVIFLDIDGVLNDEGKKYMQGVIIDKDMVAQLARIVEATDADIILSSSWKGAYKRFVEDGYQTDDKHLLMLHETFTEAGLTVSGLTPFSNESGAEARPLEIREWLRRYRNIFSYVILEDDTFWSWGYLQRNVVTTQTKNNDGNELFPYTKGLTREHADKAIAILNDAGAMVSP